MAPNLGWIDVPLGARLARSARHRRPDRRDERRRRRRPRRGEARRGRRRRQRPLRVRRGRRRRRDDRRRPPADGRRGLRGRDRPPHRSTRKAGDCRCGSIGCWETEVGEGMLLALAGYPADAGRSGIDAVLREADAGSASAIAALAHVGRWLGIGLGGLINILNPRLVILGGPHARLHPLVRGPLEAELDRYALPRPVRWCGSSRRPSASTRRSSARPRWPSSPCSPIPRPGSAAPTTRFTWRVPDVGARIRSTERIDRRLHAATGVKGVCLTM